MAERQSLKKKLCKSIWCACNISIVLFFAAILAASSRRNLRPTFSEQPLSEPEDEDHEMEVAKWIFGHGEVAKMKHTPYSSSLLKLEKSSDTHLQKSGTYIPTHGWSSKSGPIVNEGLHDGKWIKSKYAKTHGTGTPADGTVANFKVEDNALKSKYVKTHGPADPNGNIALSKIEEMRFAPRSKYLETHGPADSSGKLFKGELDRQEYHIGPWRFGSGYTSFQGKDVAPQPKLETDTREAVFGFN